MPRGLALPARKVAHLSSLSSGPPLPSAPALTGSVAAARSSGRPLSRQPPASGRLPCRHFLGGVRMPRLSKSAAACETSPSLQHYTVALDSMTDTTLRPRQDGLRQQQMAPLRRPLHPRVRHWWVSFTLFFLWPILTSVPHLQVPSPLLSPCTLPRLPRRSSAARSSCRCVGFSRFESHFGR